MDWQTANSKDLQLLERRGFAPLNADQAAGHADLVARIEQHNTRTSQAAARVRALLDARKAIADCDAWQERDCAALMAERSRVTQEGWDALLELRRVLQEREALLEQLRGRLFDRYRACDEEHSRTVAAAERRLDKERRRLMKTVPSIAGSHFADLLASDESVSTAKARLAAARSAFEDAAAAHRYIAGDVRFVTTRQREVFAALMGGPPGVLSCEV